MQKDFITVTPNSGNGNGTITLSASENQTVNQRSSTINVEGGGIKRTVNVLQEKGIVTYEDIIYIEYGNEWINEKDGFPTIWVKKGDSFILRTEVRRITYINGVEQSGYISLPIVYIHLNNSYELPNGIYVTPEYNNQTHQILVGAYSWAESSFTGSPFFDLRYNDNGKMINKSFYFDVDITN